MKDLDNKSRNQPKYHFFKNTNYALSGLRMVFRDENSFKLELFIIAPFVIISLFLDVSLVEHILLIAVMVIILIVECINSAIERCIDIVTNEYHILAKEAKDAGSAAVFLSISMAVITWVSILWDLVFG